MDKEVLGICPICGKAVIAKNKVYACEECDFKIFKTICGADIDIDNLKLILEGKESKELSMTSNKGNKFKAKLKIKEDCSGVDFVFSKTEDEVIGKCPICSNNVIKKNGLYGDYYKCSSNDCLFKLSGVIAHTKITTQIAKELLENKITKEMNFINKDGKEFKAKIAIDSDNNMKFEY